MSWSLECDNIAFCSVGVTKAYYDDFIAQLQSATDDGISFYLLKKPVDGDEIRSIARVISERRIRFRRSGLRVKTRVFKKT